MIKSSLLFTFLSFSLLITSACAENKKTTEKKSPTASLSLTKVSITDDDNFDFIKENVSLAIIDRGLIVSGTLHISDMLNRTGKDLGFDNPIYHKAEGIEFCSSKISHKMATVDPSNVAMCPFTIVVYQLTSSPKQTHLAFRQVKLKGEGAEVEKEITALLQGIVDESIE